MSAEQAPRLVKRLRGKLTCLRCGKRMQAPPSKRGYDVLLAPVEIYGIGCPAQTCRQLHLAVFRWPSLPGGFASTELDEIHSRRGYPDSVLLVTVLSSEFRKAQELGLERLDETLRRLGVTESSSGSA